MSPDSESKGLGKVVQINDARIQDRLRELLRGTLEETINAMLEAEADAMKWLIKKWSPSRWDLAG